MASGKYIAAHRRRTDKSKNALRHGLYASASVLPGENRDEFDGICDKLEAEWQPQTATERCLLEQMAVTYWSQLRMSRMRLELLQSDLEDVKRITLLDKIEQHLARLQSSHDRALKDLRSLRRARRPQQPIKPDEQNDDKSPNKVWPGLKWIDNDGKGKVVVPPAVRGPNGVFHDLPPEKWDPDDED